MKVTFALLVNDKIHNYVRKKAYDINKQYKTGFFGSLLPAHISLKQPFSIDDLRRVESYFNDLAKTISPIEISCPEVKLLSSDDLGILCLEVAENKELRGLHNRLNRELTERFVNTAAPFDGEEYRFHVTIAIGGTSPDNYEKYYNSIKDKKVDLSYTAKRIAMFYYDDNNFKPGTFMTYKILPLK